MPGTPLVSVVINFLNAAEFIEEAIESVFAQTYTSWELLLVDDGSTDYSTDIARRYAAQYPGRVRYLEHAGHQNRGTSVSRNVGGRNATGKYVAFLDADDIWLPHKLEQQVAILESRPEAAMVYGPGRWWYSWTGKVEDRQRDYIQDLGLPPDTLLQPPKLLSLFLRNEDYVPSSMAILVRREVLERVGGCDEAFRSIYDDQVVYAKIGLEAPVFVAGECWYWYRQHPAQRCQVTVLTRQYHSARLAFLTWLEAYVSGQGVRDREVWAVLRGELRPYRHPNLHRLVRRVYPYVSGVGFVQSVARRALPAPVYGWLRIQKERFSGTVAERAGLFQPWS